MTATLTRERHALLAVLDDGSTRRIGLAGDWPIMIDKWTVLDDARRAGLVPGVRYFAVRSTLDPDPRWADAPAARGEIVVLVDGNRPGPHGQAIRNTAGYDYREGAARAYARWSGRYQGREGGWIYTVHHRGDDSVRLVPHTQGWWGFATVLRSTGRLVEIDGRWYVADPKLTDALR